MASEKINITIPEENLKEIKKFCEGDKVISVARVIGNNI